jgi:hypothetical protein
MIEIGGQVTLDQHGAGGRPIALPEPVRAGGHSTEIEGAAHTGQGLGFRRVRPGDEIGDERRGQAGRRQAAVFQRFQV